MEHNILQNNAIDMYETYYSELGSVPPVEHSSCHTVNVYREPCARRPVRALSWQGDGGIKLATAHADVDLHRNSRTPQFSYIWDIGKKYKNFYLNMPVAPRTHVPYILCIIHVYHPLKIFVIFTVRS